MKTTKFLLRAAALFALALGAACGNDESEPAPEPIIDPVLTIDEGLRYDGEPIEINSVFMYEYFSAGIGRSIIALSPEKGAPSGDYLYSNQRPGLYAIINRDMPATFDLKSVGQGYGIFSLLAGTPVGDLEISTDDHSGIRRGECSFEVVDGEGRFMLDMTLADGHRITARFAAPYQELNKENRLTIGQTDRPIQTAFLAELDENLYGYYFTAQVIDPDPEMIANCSQWACLIVPGEALNGQTYTLEAADAPYYAFMAADLIDKNTFSFFEVQALPGGSCTGNFSIAMTEEGYDVSVRCTDGSGTVTTLDYQGEIVVYTEPEKKNEFLIDDNLNWEIQSALVDMRGTVCTIYLSSSRSIASIEDMYDENERLTLTLPVSMLGENGAGFSQSDAVSITYGGRTLNYQSGAVGRIDYAVVGEEHLSLKFFTMDPVKWSGIFEGEAHIIR